MSTNNYSVIAAYARSQRIIVWSGLLVILVTLCLIFWPYGAPHLHSADIYILRMINSGRLHLLDPVFIFITNTSSLVFIVIIAGMALGAWIKKSHALKMKAVQLLITFLTAFILIKTTKYTIGRERPFATYNFLEKLVSAESPSFPSGHTFEAFALATALILLFRNSRVNFIILLWAIMVGFSRIVLGVHYLSDVLGGLVFGIITGYTIHLIYNREQPGQ